MDSIKLNNYLNRVTTGGRCQDDGISGSDPTFKIYMRVLALVCMLPSMSSFNSIFPSPPPLSNEPSSLINDLLSPSEVVEVYQLQGFE